MYDFSKQAHMLALAIDTPKFLLEKLL